MDGQQARTAPGAELTAPRRNRYYYAKMMDVLHFEMEQAYGRQMRWLGNRLTLGSGVLCGLDVTVVEGQLCVAPGVAIDPLGREIVVPVTACLDPRTLLDPCGKPLPGPPGDEPRVVTLGVCYRECFTDHAPVLVSDCQTRESSEPGTVVETFRFVLEPGRPDRPAPGLCERCGEALVPGDRPGPVVGVEASVAATVEIEGAPRGVAASPDGRVAVVVSEGRPPRVHVLDAGSLAVAQLARREIAAPVGGVTFAPDGGPALVTSAGGVAVIDVSRGRPRLARTMLERKTYGKGAAARGGQLLFAIDTRTGNVDVVDVRAGAVRETIEVPGGARDVAISTDGLRLYVTGSDRDAITVRPVADLGQARDLGGFTTASDRDGALAVRPAKGRDEVLVARGAELRVVRPDGTAGTHPLPGVQARDVAASRDGSLLYLVTANPEADDSRNELVLLAAEGLRELARVEVGARPSAVAVVPDRSRAFVANAAGRAVSVVDVRPVREEPRPPDRDRLLCECTAGPCPAPRDGCVALAAVVLGPDGRPGRVESCAVRKRLYSNEVLLELIWCLARRLDECCRERPAAGPTAGQGDLR